ncbi:hydrogenase isoenzymes nickel incorporation protein HypB [Clostridium tepidiprofundi DSM 19306]|uniref:Hydrogenase isoenzymes nickel incorporation protein HypB n=1 Tax=Clostridium tepidiprofundi DSM 19306 TaxID=1121338 RepID=A0A151B754_9CLOT|nr:hydrogenase nickel incorporation protein HypB [Clostridium tepidiprofundi]KYH35633.1 hydrogenase isoenzymes nickel incorporation protein HypB [Clostridium tepidiprofundi DSM 19306]
MEIKVVRQILEWNENCHAELQKLFDEKKVLVINIMGSPGAGKTTFIKKMIEKLKKQYNIGVIEGDVAGKIDAEKIAEMGIPVVQLNTDGACHIEAMSIKNMLCDFNLDELDILIIENIGNLVCPAEFDIGEDLKIAILSIPEGDDKVEKYPLMFSRADALVLNKYDMKSVFNFDEDRVFENARNINKDIKLFKVNSVSGEGLNTFIEMIKNNIKK